MIGFICQFLQHLGVREVVVDEKLGEKAGEKKDEKAG